MDKRKGNLPIRPAALIRKQPHSRIVKFNGDRKEAQGSTKSNRFFACVKEYFELNRRLFMEVVAFFEDIFSGSAKRPNPTPSTLSGKTVEPVAPIQRTPPRKAVIVPIEEARNYE